LEAIFINPAIKESAENFDKFINWRKFGALNKELEIWQFAAERLKQNELVMLLVVAESSGSSPGRQGFKMIVAENEMRGSIGGGVMEVNLVELAREKLKNSRNETLVKTQVHQKNSPNPSGMICSGKQTVIFFKLNFNHLKIVRAVILSLEKHQSKVLQITKNDIQIRNFQLIDSDYKFEHRAENQFTFEEKIGFKNNLYIVGGGHCALALSELMSKMDFNIALFDDRIDLNTLAKNEFVHEKTILESYENIGKFILSGTNVYVVVMTLGFAFDEIVIKNLIDKDFKYFGVLGSRAKMKTLFRKLEKEGCSIDKLNQIRTPVGLPINSRTPEEIAVSIAAEIIAVKNEKL
jgi:xanthine dehydrogenase accessory factor